MQRSASSPGGGSLRASSSDALPKAAGSLLDFSRVERDQLPIGVSTIVASRMRLDATAAPAMLDLRMNYRNLLNEMKLNEGKIVSHQYALMKPRRKSVWEKPQELKVPEGCDPVLFRRVARRRAREKCEPPASRAEELEQGPRQSASPTNKARAQDPEEGDGQEDEDEGALAPAARDPTAALEVQELLNDDRVQAAHSSLQDPPHSGFLPQARIPRALEALGFTSPDPALMKASIKSLVRFDATAPEGSMTLALDEFCAIVYAFTHQRQEQLRDAFKSLDRDGSGSISTREFRHLLWDLGFTVAEGTIEEIYTEVDLDRSGQVELPEFEAALKILHDRHGFTKAEAAELLQIFDRYDLDRSGQMSANELASALGWFGTPTTIAQAQEIIRRFDEDVDGLLCRCEFLMIMRSRLEDEITEIRALFAEFDYDCRGAMSGKQLAKLFQRLGYTIPHEVVQESIKELGPATTIMGLVFEDVCKLLHTIRKRHGFSKSEMKELLDVYHTYDKNGKGQMRDFELAHALNWLGYPISHQRRRKLWCTVDVDKSNAIDEGEFLKLMRMLREEETAAVLRLLEEAAGQGVPREKDTKEMLNQLGYASSAAFVSQAFKGEGKTDVLGLLTMLRTLHDEQAANLRLSAGLPDHLAAKIRGKFSARVEAGKRVDPVEFERFMYELFKSSRASPVEREKIKQLIRDHCVEGTLGLQEMFWVVRLYSDLVEESKVDNERSTSLQVGFSEQQVAQFRQAFVEADMNGSGELSEQEILMVFDDVVSMNAHQVNLLKAQMSQLGEKKDCIDFTEFLRLLGTIIENTGD